MEASANQHIRALDMLILAWNITWSNMKRDFLAGQSWLAFANVLCHPLGFLFARAPSRPLYVDRSGQK